MEPPPSYADALTAKQQPPHTQPPQPPQPQPHYYVPETIIVDACPHPQLSTPAEARVLPSSVRLFIFLLRVFILIIIITLFVFTTIRVVKYLSHA